MEWYVEKLSADEIREALKMWVWRENDVRLRAILEFFLSELKENKK